MNDQVVSDTVIGTGTPLTDAQLKLFSTVSQMFAEIRIALAQTGVRVDVTYDSATGHPTKLFVDPDANAADEEFGFTTTSLLKLSN